MTQVSSPSLHELMSTNIRSFHVHVHFSIGTLCLLKFVSSTRCLQASQLIWSTKPWHSRGKGRRPLLDIYWRTEEGDLIAPRPVVEPPTYRSRVQRSTNATTFVTKFVDCLHGACWNSAIFQLFRFCWFSK